MARTDELGRAKVGNGNRRAILLGAVVGALLPVLLAAPRLLWIGGSDGGANAALAVLLFGPPIGALSGAALGWGLAMNREPGRSRGANALLLAMVGLVIGFLLGRGAGDSTDQLRLIALCTALAALAGILMRPR